MPETFCARPWTDNLAWPRSAPWLTTCPRGSLRREPLLPRAVAAPAAHDGEGCPAPPCRRPLAALRCRGLGLRPAGGPDLPRGQLERALDSTPAAAGVAGQGGHHVPPPPTPRAPTKKMSLQASERETPRGQRARTASRLRVATLALRRLSGVAAAGVNRALPRQSGRAPTGARVIAPVPQHDGHHGTLLAALGVQGVQAVMTVEGATEAEVLRPAVQRGLGPTLAPGEIVVLDHLAAHQARGVPQALARRQVQRLFWPPSSPEVSPIERCVSQLKTAWRAAKARTREALETASQQALETVTAPEAWNWFKYCGYAL